MFNLVFSTLRETTDMGIAELAAELVNRSDFSPEILKHLNRSVLEKEVADARREKIIHRQLWLSQAEREIFIILGKGGRENQYLMRSLETGRNHWIDYNTLEGPNWTRIA